MADYCKQCAILMNDQDPGEDMAGICEEGKLAAVLCEGCGSVWVDHRGVAQNWEWPTDWAGKEEDAPEELRRKIEECR